MARSVEGIEIEAVAYHRNGVGGVPFHVVIFSCEEGEMVGVVFDYEENKDNGEFYNMRTAVLERNLLAEGKIEFGVNSWRGDVYHRHLMDAIREWWKERGIQDD